MIIEKKCSTVYSESESEWHSSNSDEESVEMNNVSKQRSYNNKEESKSKERQKLANSESIRFSQIRNKIKVSLFNNNSKNFYLIIDYSDTIYNDDSNKLKDMILKILKSKIVKYKVNPKNKLCKEKIAICTALIKEITSNKIKKNNLKKLKKYQVEFSEVYNLIKRYMRSMNLSCINSHTFEKIEVENKINQSSHCKPRVSIKKENFMTERFK